MKSRSFVTSLLIIRRRPGAHLNLAKALIALNRSEEAVAAARVAVEQRPDSHDALINLGVALSHLEHFDEAERHFRRAVEIAPHESGPVANLGVLLQRRNRPDEAETALRRALVLAPRDLSVLGNLAKLLDMRQQFGEALDLYDRLIEVGSVDVSVYAARGNIFYRLHRYEEAMASARQALALDPDPPTAFSLHILLGQASWALTQSADAAADHYERALLIDPNHPTVLADLASLRIAQERYDKALELFETAVRLRPDVAKFYSAWGSRCTAWAGGMRRSEALNGQCLGPDAGGGAEVFEIGSDQWPVSSGRWSVASGCVCWLWDGELAVPDGVAGFLLSSWPVTTRLISYSGSLRSRAHRSPIQSV